MIFLAAKQRFSGGGYSSSTSHCGNSWLIFVESWDESPQLFLYIYNLITRDTGRFGFFAAYGRA
ncbi:hypothetical protein GQF03_06580 [Sneathiella chungangensis]|uniref:Uncharacterized protein n=1 Tax=Sneathiella chungangensis TaxID=1418234 RepID=A0A845MEF2_9PROT|nr:hypothetical protein [Sneathiella chungangensis]MZR21992.1 hypothetical protein [Sneathiella chungangensis]